MSKRIIYSYKEYQERYILLLDDFCENTEFDEIDFITTEIDCYSIYLTSLGIYKRIRHRFPGDPFLDEDTIFLNTNCAFYDFIVEAIKNKAISKGLKSTDDIITNCKIHFNKIISFLETKKSELETDLKTDAPRHEHIFCNNGFELFEDILSEYVKPIGKKGRLSDIHYYYWKMYEDDFIHQRPERFKTWFFETYEKEDLGKIKTLKEVENLDRNIHYETALGWFKQQHR